MVWFGMVSTIGQPDLVNGRLGNEPKVPPWHREL
jgi:hypothetical protein